MTQKKMLRTTLTALLVLILLAALIVPPVSADYWETLTSVNTTSWRDMTNNITTTRDVIIPALRGNGTVVMNNATSLPWYNLTTSYTIIATSGTQPLTFTMPSTGTYLITANIRENTTLTAPSLTGYTEYGLCDAGNTAIVTNTERMGSRVQDVNNFSAASRSFSWIYTNSTGATSVSVCGKLDATVSGRYGVVSDSLGRSIINYLKLA